MNIHFIAIFLILSIATSSSFHCELSSAVKQQTMSQFQAVKDRRVLKAEYLNASLSKQ